MVTAESGLESHLQCENKLPSFLPNVKTLRNMPHILWMTLFTAKFHILLSLHFFQLPLLLTMYKREWGGVGWEGGGEGREEQG